MGKSWVKIASIYIGTVIGAGFASGREIMDFFGVYGVKGMWGIYISGILFAIVGALLLLKIKKYKVKSFNDLNIRTFGKRISKIIDLIIIISLYTGYSIMISGSGAIFQEQLGLSFNLGMMIMIICSFTVFLFSLDGLSFINSILVPILIIGILFISISIGHNTDYRSIDISGERISKKGNFISSAILYFGSNSLIITIVFSTLLPMIKDKKTAILGGVVGGGILYILGISILYSMLIYYKEVFILDIPMLRISGYVNEGYGRIYTIILWIAMFTTALANGYGFVNRYSKNRSKVLVSGLFCISAIPLAKLGFSNLVGTIYPIFGVIGIIMIILFLLR